MNLGRKNAGLKLALLPALLLSGTAQAGFSHLDGGSGLVMMGTADVLEHASADVGLFTRMDTYRDPSGQEIVDYALIPSVSVGLFNRVELGLMTTAMQSPRYDVSGMQSARAFMKLRLAGGEGAPFAAAISGFGGTTADPVDGLGSGDASSGGDLLFSYYSRNFGMHLSLGARTVETIGFVNNLTGGFDRVYTSGKLKRAAVGIELHPRSDVAVTLEGISTSDEQNTVEGYIVPGVKFAPSRDWAFTVGFAVGNPSDRSAPRTQYFAGVSYGDNDPRRVGRPLGVALRWTDKRPSLGVTPLDDAWFKSAKVTDMERAAATAIDVAATRAAAQVLDATASVTNEMLNPVKYRPLMTSNSSTQFVKCSKLPSAGSPCTMQVEVINASGDPVLAEKVARLLRDDGYDVARVTDLDYRQIISWVYYRPGYPEEAVSLAHHIPMDQIVTRELSLDPGITIRVVVGTDMIPLGSRL